MVQKSQFSSDAAKFSSLGVVWAVIAAVAFVKGTWIADYSSGSAQVVTGLQYTTAILQKGLAVFKGGQTTSLSDPGALAYFVLILLIPVSIVAIFVTSLAMRGHVLRISVVRLYILFGLIGLIATIALFIPYVVENTKVQGDFLLAAAVVVASGVLTRVQQWLRNLFQKNPAVASVGLLVVTGAVLLLANYTTFAQTILTQVGIWLSLVAFTIVIWSGITLRREAIRARRVGK